MKTLCKIVVFGAAVLALAGCVTVTDAPAGSYAVGAAYTVTLGREWSDISKAMPGEPTAVHLLSIDGPLLNRLYLTEGLAPGDYLVKASQKERPTPTYRAGMSPTEIVEFVADSVSALDYERVETSGLRPGTFSGSPALRFDISAETKDGLQMSGAAEAAEVGGKLYVMLYIAPKEHYFAAGLPEVEQILASAKKTG